MGNKISIFILNNEINLDYTCWNCGGGTKKKENFTNIPFWTEEGVCEICHGTGFIPTDNGAAIIRFVKRHVKGGDE